MHFFRCIPGKDCRRLHAEKTRIAKQFIQVMRTGMQSGKNPDHGRTNPFSSLMQHKYRMPQVTFTAVNSAPAKDLAAYTTTNVQVLSAFRHQHTRVAGPHQKGRSATSFLSTQHPITNT